MPLLALLHLAIVIGCVLHVIKRGHDLFWIFIILLFPGVGVLIYLLAIVMPEMRNSQGARRTAQQIRKTMIPNEELHNHMDALTVSDTVDNKVNLAEELMKKGKVDEAIELYRNSLKGIYEHDPHLMLGYSRALFAKQQYNDVIDILDSLIKHNPDYRSQEGHLLYARSLAELKEYDRAEHEFDALERYYSGYEAKCRYAMLLKLLGRHDEALDRFGEIVANAERASKHTRHLNAEWIRIAKEHI